MTTIEAQRQDAAARYAQAAGDYIEAARELAALDQAAANVNAGGNGDLRTFAAQPAVLPHPVALPDVGPLHHDYAGRVAARRDQLLAAR